MKTSTLLATAKAIYHASCVIDNDIGRPVPSFERLPPNTKDLYAAMAKAAAEAIDRMPTQDDIAAKCRQYAAWVRAWDAYEPGKPEVPQAINYQDEAQTFDEAAAEIERLRAAERKR